MDFDSTLLDNISESELVKLIERHNKLYWEKGEAEITDEDFDLLIRKLQQLNPTHPLVDAVNAPVVASSGKVRHSKPMLSLDKAYSLEELLVWAKKNIRSTDEVFLVQPKYDGISANYSGGLLVTRGDGTEGENITDKIPLIELETKNYKGPLNRPVRGEIVIRDDDFKTLYANIRKKDGKNYKNSRNAVAGIMGLKEIDEMLLQKAKLTLIDYDMISYSVKYCDFEKEWPMILHEVESLPYPMDGLVIKLADSEYSESLGNTAHHPRGQIAFKFSGVRRHTKLLAVDWSFGKSCLTPVALLEPVDIGGITVRHATLHNVQNIIDKDIKIGDTVLVERAGDVIPYIISAEPGTERKNSIITECPCCKSPLIQDGPDLCCTNPECPETLLQKLLAAVRNIGIEHLGEPNIRKMMNVLNVKNLRDIFKLKVIDILKLDGFKAKSAGNLFTEIQAAKKVNDYQLLASLNIYGIGKNVAKSILVKYTLDELRSLTIEQLSEIDGIGPERAAALEKEMKAQAAFLDELLKCVELTQSKGGEISSGRKICFTGKMPEQRSFYEDMARSRGYEPVDTVTSDLAVLVAVDISGNSSKLSKARSAGIKILSLDEWLTETQNTPEVKTQKKEETKQDHNGQLKFDF